MESGFPVGLLVEEEAGKLFKKSIKLEIELFFMRLVTASELFSEELADSLRNPVECSCKFSSGFPFLSLLLDLERFIDSDSLRRRYFFVDESILPDLLFLRTREFKIPKILLKFRKKLDHTTAYFKIAGNIAFCLLF